MKMQVKFANMLLHLGISPPNHTGFSKSFGKQSILLLYDKATYRITLERGKS